MTGKDLLKELIAATGLPASPVKKELGELLEKGGLQEESCALEDLRVLLSDYAQDILAEAKKTFGR